MFPGHKDNTGSMENRWAQSRLLQPGRHQVMVEMNWNQRSQISSTGDTSPTHLHYQIILENTCSIHISTTTSDLRKPAWEGKNSRITVCLSWKDKLNPCDSTLDNHSSYFKDIEIPFSALPRTWESNLPFFSITLHCILYFWNKGFVKALRKNVPQLQL